MNTVACVASASQPEALEQAPTLSLDEHGTQYPSRPIRLVVPFPTGASTDTIARIIAEPVERRMGWRVNIDNRSGAGGNIGAELVARAAPDGYTMLIGTAGLLTINASLYPEMRFDPAFAFAPLTLVASVPYVLVVHPSLPPRSLATMIEFARRRPWILNYGSAGNGSTIHLGIELFKAMTGTKLVHVPYRGGAPAIGELLGGHIHIMFSSVPLALPYIEAGRLRALAVSSAKRAKRLPSVPTLEQGGLRGFEFGGWFALLVPVHTPQRIVSWLNQELVVALEARAVRSRLDKIGAEAVTSSPRRVSEMMRRDSLRWQRVIRTANVRPDWEEYPR